MSNYYLSIDQGTTSCRAIIYDADFNIVSSSQKEFTQYYPQAGWVEHDALEIWSTQLFCCQQAVLKSKLNIKQIKAIGITNQRETIVAWDKNTGVPVYNAIVWQDRRTANQCESDVKNIGLDENRRKTGLNIDAYFSAPKIRWILQNIPNAKLLIDNGQLCVGTIDTWIIWNLTGREAFVTDFSNASRTNLFNIQSLTWDEELLAYYQIPLSILPSVKSSVGQISITISSLLGAEIPISGIAGDQQAALYGHACFESGMMKNTFGTGCFLLQNIGDTFKLSENNLLTTIAWREDEKITYAIEGSVFNAGSALKWLKEKLHIISDYREIEMICRSIPDTDGVFMVPAFTGLGAPYWDMFARGIIVGLTRNSDRRHIVRATVESLAFQTKDIMDTMSADSGLVLDELQVDGGVSESDFLLQFLADILQIKVIRNSSKECTALGVAMMAAKGLGESIELNNKNMTNKACFVPKMSRKDSEIRYVKWADAIQRSKGWAL